MSSRSSSSSSSSTNRKKDHGNGEQQQQQQRTSTITSSPPAIPKPRSRQHQEGEEEEATNTQQQIPVPNNRRAPPPSPPRPKRMTNVERREILQRERAEERKLLAEQQQEREPLWQTATNYPGGEVVVVQHTDPFRPEATEEELRRVRELAEQDDRHRAGVLAPPTTTRRYDSEDDNQEEEEEEDVTAVARPERMTNKQRAEIRRQQREKDAEERAEHRREREEARRTEELRRRALAANVRAPPLRRGGAPTNRRNVDDDDAPPAVEATRSSLRFSSMSDGTDPDLFGARNRTAVKITHAAPPKSYNTLSGGPMDDLAALLMYLCVEGSEMDRPIPPLADVISHLCAPYQALAVCCGGGHAVRFFSTQDGALLNEWKDLSLEPVAICSLTISEIPALAVAYTESIVCIRDRFETKSFRLGNEYLNDIISLPDERLAISAMSAGKIFIHCAQTLEQKVVIRVSKPGGMAHTPSGTLVAVCSEGMEEFDFNTGSSLRKWNLSGISSLYGLSPMVDGRFCACRYARGDLYLFPYLSKAGDRIETVQAGGLPRDVVQLPTGTIITSTGNLGEALRVQRPAEKRSTKATKAEEILSNARHDGARGLKLVPLRFCSIPAPSKDAVVVDVKGMPAVARPSPGYGKKLVGKKSAPPAAAPAAKGAAGPAPGFFSRLWNRGGANSSDDD